MKILIVGILFLVYSGMCWSQIPETIYDVDYDGHLYFDLSFNSFDVDGNFIFDTGSSNLYLDTLFFQKNTFPDYRMARGIIKGTGTGESEVKVILTPVYFSINHRKKFKSDTTVLLDLKTRFGQQIDGVFGLNFFQDKAIKINYQQEQIEFLDTLDPTLLKGYKAVPLSISDNRFFITCEIALNPHRKLRGKFIIDTGNPSELNINTGFFNLNAIEKKVKYRSFGGLGGDSEGYTILIDGITIKGFSFKNVPTDFSTNESGALAHSDYLGIIGNGLLEKFELIIDKRNYVLYLKPSIQYSRPFQSSKLDFCFNDNHKNNKGWIVNTVYQGLNAHKAGLKIRDRIFRVNGKSVDLLNGKLPNQYIRDGLKLRILRDGEVLKINFYPNNILEVLNH